MLTETKIAVLMAGLDKLPAKDRKFALSLCDGFYEYGSSTEKQRVWIDKFVEMIRARTESEPLPEPFTPHLDGLVGLFAKARETRKGRNPRLLLLVDTQELQLSLAASWAKVPDCINVMSSGGYGNREWYGRVMLDGTFQPSRNLSPRTISSVTKALQAISDDPANSIAEYGLTTGVCAICGYSLTDARSREVGYGPTCAEHWGLPWGSKTVDDTERTQHAIERWRNEPQYTSPVAAPSWRKPQTSTRATDLFEIET